MRADIENLKYEGSLFTIYGDISHKKLISYLLDTINVTQLEIGVTVEIVDVLQKDFKEINITSLSKTIYRLDNKYEEMYKVFIDQENDIVIVLDLKYGCTKRDYHIAILSYVKESEIVSKYKKLLDSYKYQKVKETLPEFKVIVHGSSGFYTQTFTNTDLDYNEYYYNSDFNLDKVKKELLSDKSGLLLFSGVPGSGKSSLIKYLAKTLDKSFYYATQEIISMFNSPDAITFLMAELKDSILVLEDCENLLLSRKINKGSGITTILNLTDGIIGNALKLKIIATINTSDKIDEALLRKSRTLYSYDFKLLTPERANKCAEVLGIKEHFSTPIALTDIFNYYEDNGTSIQGNKIGF